MIYMEKCRSRLDSKNGSRGCNDRVAIGKNTINEFLRTKQTKKEGNELREGMKTLGNL